MRLNYLFLFITSLFFISNSYAQTGTIRATVYDDEFGETLIGATVVIEGTSNGNVTDLDGKAAITGLEPGLYNVGVSFVSFEKQVITDVEVKANEVTTLEIRMKEETVGLQEVVVTAEALKDSERAMLTVQKKSAKVLDAITSDMFSRTGDNDAAGAVRRVVGVTLESGKYVYVRGLGDRYSKSTLNGADIPSLDPNRNSVQMDLFPSNLIDNIIVYKTFTPDLPGDFSGGLVNIATKEFPDAFTLQASASLSYNSQASLNSDFLTYEGSSTDFLGFDNNSRNVPDYVKNYHSSASNLNYPLANLDPDSDVEQYTEAFTNRQFNPTRASQPLNHSMSFSAGNQGNFLGKQVGFIGGLTYNRNLSFYNDGMIGRWNPISSGTSGIDDDKNYELNDTRSLDEVNWGALLNTSIKLNQFNKIGLILMHNQSGLKEARYQEGAWDGKGRINDDTQFSTSNARGRVLSWTERGVSNAGLKGEHTFGKLSMEWLSSYTYSTFDQPDLRFLQDNYFIRNGETEVNYEITNKNRPAKFFRDMSETSWDTKIHFTLPVTVIKDYETKIKFGGAYTTKDRVYREDIFNYNLRGTAGYQGDPSELFTSENLALDSEGNLTGSTVEVIGNDPNNYDADQTITAGYLMFDSPLTDKLRTNFGARVENTDQSVTSFDPTKFGDIKNTDVLPAINFTYEFVENSNIRASYSKTLARPSFREFAPFASFGFYGDNVQNGNDSLKRTTINNVDLRIERYPRSGEYVALSLFYKDLTNPIENTFVATSAENDLNLIYRNVPKASLYGAEFEVRKSLDFISPAFRYFRANVNLSYIYSQVEISESELSIRRNFDAETPDTRPMYNQSPYVVNASLEYENPDRGLSSAVTFNVYGERLKLISIDLLDVYEQPRPELGFYIKKQLGEAFSVRFRASNLLNPKIQELITYESTDYIYSSYTRGISFSFGVNYNIGI